MSKTAAGAGALMVLVAGAAVAQESAYRVGERVELKITDGHWQSCTVMDPGGPERVMRMKCDAYSNPVKSRGAGIYVASPDSTDVRQIAMATRAAAAPARAVATSRSSAGASGYQVGQAVELEASGHWVPCTVSQPAPNMRVRCTAYPALSRAAGEYVVHDQVGGIRPATGRTGRAAPAPVAPARTAAAPAGTLRVGEYACYGSGGRIMAGFGFKVTGAGRYTDLDGATSGTFSVSGSTVTFRGGHLGGQTGRDLTAKGFRIGAQADCEFWG